MNNKYSCIVMGAAGRDFHIYLSFLRNNPHFHVEAFTATQIPFIDDRIFPASLAGADYPDGIPIFDESELTDLIRNRSVDFVFFAYSDIAHSQLMHKASLVQAAGASFVMLGPDHTQLESMVPVISITATRTGAGKSPLTQWLARSLMDKGKSVSVIRHPMPYGNLSLQRVQCFNTPEDLDRQECTIEEREEYDPYVKMGIPIYAGVDYRGILDEAQGGVDVVLWDGGNNDFSFIRPDLNIVVVDALRAGHEIDYFPGEVNFRRADVLVISKCETAAPGAVEDIRERAAQLNPDATVCTSDLEIMVDKPDQLMDQKVLVIEDGPTVTHGGMSFGAGIVAAQQYGARPVDPRPYAEGTIRDVFTANPHLERVLPAMGYSDFQRASLRKSALACCRGEGIGCILDASPAFFDWELDDEVPVVRVSYRFVQLDGPSLLDRVMNLLEQD